MSTDKKPTYKLPSEYETYECDDQISQEEHNQHLSRFKNQYFNGEAHMESLKKDINELHENISKIQARHHSDYISTFNQFMETVKFDIKEKIQKMDKVQEERAKDENILKIVAERNLFREEAIRLNLYNKTMVDQMEGFKRKLKEKEEDYDQIYKKWQISEDYNHQLIQELNSCVKFNQQLQKKFEALDLKQFQQEKVQMLSTGINNNFPINFGNTTDNFKSTISNFNKPSNKKKEKTSFDNFQLDSDEELNIENESFESFKSVSLY